jgi:DNA-directed RNA polymerase subunit RPC12/RpoP
MIGGKQMEFICFDCNRTFENPRRYVETHGLDTPPYETSYACPYCGGDYARAYECDECGHWIVGEYIKTARGRRICENCYITYEIGEE